VAKDQPGSCVHPVRMMSAPRSASASAIDRPGPRLPVTSLHQAPARARCHNNVPGVAVCTTEGGDIAGDRAANSFAGARPEGLIPSEPRRTVAPPHIPR
jgi:hypothetical protein